MKNVKGKLSILSRLSLRTKTSSKQWSVECKKSLYYNGKWKALMVGSANKHQMSSSPQTTTMLE